MMSDVMPRVILDELVALAVHHLGDEPAARELVDEVLAEHPDLAAAAVEAPSPAERLQAVDRLFGRVRWAVRDRLPGVTAPSPAAARPASSPWAPSLPPKPLPLPGAASARSLAVPPAATMPQLRPPRTFIPTIVLPGAEPEAQAPEPPDPIPTHSIPAEPDDVLAGLPEPVSPDPDPPAPVSPEPVPPRAELWVAPPSDSPPRKMRPRPNPLAGASTEDPLAPAAPRPQHHHEPPPLQVEIVDDLYGIEAAARRRRRVVIGLAGLAVAAGLVVLADLPRLFTGSDGAATSHSSTTAEAPSNEPGGTSQLDAPQLDALQLDAPQPDALQLDAQQPDAPQLDALQLESPDAADRPSEALADGTRRILRFDPTPEPAAGPVSAPTSAAGASPGDGAVRVFIHYDAAAASSSAAAVALYGRLADAAAYATVVLRDVPYAIGRNRVRYFYAADRPAAVALVKRLDGPPGVDWQLQDFTNYRPLPARGTLEVFVPTN